MAAPTMSQIREGLAANLNSIPETQVSAWMLANPTPPSIEVFPDEIRFDKAMQRGMDETRMIVRVLIGVPSDIGVQKRLDEYLAATGTRSVKAAVESDRTLGGAVSDLIVTRAFGYRMFALEGRTPVLGCEWEVEIIANGA